MSVWAMRSEQKASDDMWIDVVLSVEGIDEQEWINPKNEAEVKSAGLDGDVIDGASEPAQTEITE